MHLTPLGTKDTEGAGKGSLHLKGLQSRAGHSREKHPLVVLGERNSPNLSKRRKRRVQGPRGGARPIKLGKRGGEPDRAKSARLEELLSVSRNHSNLSLSKGMMDLGTFCRFCFVWQSLSRLGWP